MSEQWDLDHGSIIGKCGPALNEDALVIHHEFWAVIDGSADKSGLVFELDGEEATGGRFAAQVITRALRAISHLDEPRAVVDELSLILHEATERQHPGLDVRDLPSARLSVLDASRDIAWSVGDCQIAVSDGQECSLHDGQSAIDKSLADVRAAILEAHAMLGTAPSESAPDPGREAILPALRMQAVFANQSGEFSYGAINGTRVPDHHIWTRQLAGAHHVVLATDGYPFVLDRAQNSILTLPQAEAALHAALAEDPLCVGVLRGTKGLRPGRVSFDDRAWLSVKRTVATVATPE